MALLQNTFEGGTNGTTFTTSNSGGSSGTAFNVATGSGGSRTYTTTNVMHGNTAGRITAAVNETQIFGYDNLFSTTSLAIRFYITFLADTTANGASICQVRNDSGQVCDVSMFTGLSLRAGNSGSGTLSDSIYTVSLNTVYRIELYVENGTTTGRYKYAIYAGESTTALASADLTDTDMGSVPFTRARFGKTGTPGSVDYVVDTIAVQDSATGFIGAYTEGGGNAGSDQTVEPWSLVTLTGTGTGTWSQTAGTAVSLSGSGNVRTFTAPGTVNGETYTFSFGGDTVNITSMPATERLVLGGTEVAVLTTTVSSS